MDKIWRRQGFDHRFGIRYSLTWRGVACVYFTGLYLGLIREARRVRWLLNLVLNPATGSLLAR